jgi:hypothetical protein
MLEGPETERLVKAVPVPTFPFNATGPVLLVIVKA